MKPPFVVLALPRSRSFWLSRFLTYGNWHCSHDELVHARTLEDAKTWLNMPCTGTVETNAAPWWRLIRHYRPDANVVVLRRPVGEVMDSLVRVGFTKTPQLAARIEYLDQKLVQVSQQLSVLAIEAKDLDDADAAQNIFERCLPYEFDPNWYAKLRNCNLQIDMRTAMRYYAAYERPLNKLASIAKQQSLMLMTQRKAQSAEGLTFQQEPLADLIRDGQDLFKEHAVAVGESTDTWAGKNIPMMQVLEQMGCLQITTARCNGRMFGYLMSIISASLEDRNTITAGHNLFYASPEFPGLGLKLQRASLNALKERGVDEAYLWCGTRASGDRISALYKRMGAVEHGRSYKIQLNT